MAHQLRWYGREVEAQTLDNTSRAMGRFGLEVEREAKLQLRKGHGVVTGTLRRSIHCANPTYNWAGDNVEPSAGAPERGGSMILPLLMGNRLILSVGSGLEYALPVHNGHHSFGGYAYLTIGLERAYPRLANILRQYANE